MRSPFFRSMPRMRTMFITELAEIFRRVVLIPLDLPKAKGAGELLDYAVRLFSHEPYNLTKYCRPIVRKRLTRIAAAGEIRRHFMRFSGCRWRDSLGLALPKSAFHAQRRSGHLATSLSGRWKSIVESCLLAGMEENGWSGTEVFEESRSCSCCFTKRSGCFLQIPGSAEVDGRRNRSGHGIFPTV